jgi:hypothetical protein
MYVHIQNLNLVTNVKNQGARDVFSIDPIFIFENLEARTPLGTTRVKVEKSEWAEPPLSISAE